MLCIKSLQSSTWCVSSCRQIPKQEVDQYGISVSKSLSVRINEAVFIVITNRDVHVAAKSDTTHFGTHVYNLTTRFVLQPMTHHILISPHLAFRHGFLSDTLNSATWKIRTQANHNPHKRRFQNIQI